MNGKTVLISAILALLLAIPAFGGEGGPSILAVNIDSLGSDAVLNAATLMEIVAQGDEIDDTLIPIRGTVTSDEKMCLIIYDPAHIMFDAHLVSLETEIFSDDIRFVSVGDYSDGVPVFDLAVVKSDGTVRRYKKDALVDEYLELEEGMTLLAFVTMHSCDSEEIPVCQVQESKEQYVEFEHDEELAYNRSIIAFHSS